MLPADDEGLVRALSELGMTKAGDWLSKLEQLISSCFAAPRWTALGSNPQELMQFAIERAKETGKSAPLVIDALDYRKSAGRIWSRP